MMSQNNKPIASLSLDLDNEWAYLKAHGESSWTEFPSYFNVLIPGLLDLLDKKNLKITWFIVGQDAVLDHNCDALEEITRRGHEVGNHSYNHEPWLQQYSRAQLIDEISMTEDSIYKVTGERTRGFRGPGFSWNSMLFSILNDRKYLYDASLLPTYLGPLARKYYFWKSDLSPDEKELRSELYGSFKDGLRPAKPYLWEKAGQKLILELPVTTIPLLKVPFHMSYLLYLGGFSEALMMFYLNLAVYLCKLTHTTINFLLHPLDFLDGKQVPSLAFFPAMETEQKLKVERFRKVIGVLNKNFRIVPMSELATEVLMNNNLKSAELT